MEMVEVVECKVSTNRIKTTYEKLGLTQERLARLAGISWQQLRRLISDDSCPSLERAKKLSIVLGVPIDELWTFKVKKRAAAGNGRRRTKE